MKALEPYRDRYPFVGLFLGFLLIVAVSNRRWIEEVVDPFPPAPMIRRNSWSVEMWDPGGGKANYALVDGQMMALGNDPPHLYVYTENGWTLVIPSVGAASTVTSVGVVVPTFRPIVPGDLPR